jgi:two-component system chemotaxis sensor kinase CheA
MAGEWESLRRKLLEAFAVEIEGHVRALNEGALALERARLPEERSALVQELYRTIHTIKGSSRAVDAPVLERLAHALEALLGPARDDLAAATHAAALVLRAADASEAAPALLLGAGLPPDFAASLLDEIGRLPTDAPSGLRPRSVPDPAPLRRADEVADGAARRTVHLDAERLDALHQASALLVQCLGATDRLAAEIEAVRELVAHARRTSTAAGDLREIEASLAQIAQHAGSRRRAERRLGRRVDDGVRELRLVSFGDAASGLDRVARDLAVTLKKEIRLEIGGRELELDRAVVEALREPLLHLVRNAADHGIEDPDARAAAGKPRHGTVRIEPTTNGTWIEVVVEDDGAGVATAAVRQALEVAGRDVSLLDDEAIVEAVFEPGVTTARALTSISGRGVGLDAVRAAVRRLGGTLRITSRPGEGARVALGVPAAVGVEMALLARVGGAVVSVSLPFVARVDPYDRALVEDVGGALHWSVGTRRVPLASLGAVLAFDGETEEPGFVVVLSAEGRMVACLVDEVLGHEELVLRAVPPALEAPGLFRAAAVRPDGSVVLVLAVVEAMRLARQAPRRHGRDAPEPARKKRILLVDDSLVTRNLERALLEAAGYEVTAEIDGLAAWEALKRSSFDAVVSDVEMPHLDGFALTERIRTDPKLRSLPVILVTSRGSAEDRARGLSAGADRYLTKAGFDERDLVDALATFV